MEQTKEIINEMKLGIWWEQNIPKKGHPFFKYLKENNNDAKGWICKKYQKIIENINKDLTSDAKLVYINQYNLFVDLSKTLGPLNNW